MLFVCSESRGLGIVRDHDNRLVQFAIERGKDIKNLFAGTRIEIAGRLVRQN